MERPFVNYTFVILTVGKEIPIKKPNIKPVMIVITSLMLSFDCLRNPLQINRMCNRTERNLVK